MAGKRLELLKEAVPAVTRVAILANPTNPSYALQLQETQVAAQALGVHLHVVEVQSPDEFENAFAAMTSAGASALFVAAPDASMLERHVARHRRAGAEASAACNVLLADISGRWGPHVL